MATVERIRSLAIADRRVPAAERGRGSAWEQSGISRYPRAALLAPVTDDGRCTRRGTRTTPTASSATATTARATATARRFSFRRRATSSRRSSSSARPPRASCRPTKICSASSRAARTGTGMPPWQYLLSDEDRWALVDYVKTFDHRASPTSASRKRCRCLSAPGPNAQLERGHEVYDEDAMREVPRRRWPRRRAVVAHAASTRKGRYVNTRDFTQPGSYRTGWTEREIVRTLETGMNGTPMPSYTGVDVEPRTNTTWSAYVMSLASTDRATRSGRWPGAWRALARPTA